MTEEYKPCECESPGFCPRYRKEMNGDKWKKCKNHEKYRKLFDELAGNENHGMIKKGDDIPKNIPRHVYIKTRTLERSKLKSIKATPEMASIKEEKRLAYKALEEVKKAESEGLGDDIEKILTKMGITKGLLSRVIGRTCGCDKRRKTLNRLFSYIRE